MKKGATHLSAKRILRSGRTSAGRIFLRKAVPVSINEDIILRGRVLTTVPGNFDNGASDKKYDLHSTATRRVLVQAQALIYN